MTAEAIAGLAGFFLSLALSFVPGLRTWYEALNPDQKRLVLLGSLAVVAVGLGINAVINGTPWQEAVGEATRALFAAAVASQVTYALTPRGAPR